MNNDKRQSSSKENLIYALMVKPEVGKVRADLFITEQKTEKSMFNDKTMEAICERSNLELAYKKVCQNKGAPGIDRVKVEDFREYLKVNWQTAKKALLKGAYKPQAVRQVEIPKPKGGKRVISIFRGLDSWIRHRLRSVQWKQWKLYKCRKQNLIRLGVDPGTAHQTAWAGKGIWRMSNMPGTRIATRIKYFRDIGLAELSSMKSIQLS